MTGICEFFRIIIWKLSNFMKPINTEKISVNSLIWLRNLQWRRKEFFRSECSGHLKTIKHPPQGVRGAKAPRKVAKFHFLKRFKVFEKEPFIKNVNIFLPQNIHFSKKNLGKSNIFYKNFWIFSKNYFKFSLFMIPYKSREILCEFKHLNEKFMKKLKK